jgi:hypothetical protein
MTAIFISYASEDKAIAQPLADILLRLGLEVWFDDYVLTVGDSLKAKIDDGLSRCDYGIVILSELFLESVGRKKNSMDLRLAKQMRSARLCFRFGTTSSKKMCLSFLQH